MPRWQQGVLAAQPLVPLVRRVFLAQTESFEPACGWNQWLEWERWLRRREARVARWVHMRSQWGKPRSSVLGLGRTTEPHVFVTVEPLRSPALHPIGTTSSFRVPSLRDTASSEEWLLRSFDPVPRFHRTPRWDPGGAAVVSDEASRLLATQFPRPSGTPPHWRPMHGDFVPWNLREDRDGVLWLLDWEDAAWAPPFADVVRYAVAYHSMQRPPAHDIARTVREALPDVSPGALAEAAMFWATHPNLKRPEPSVTLSKGGLEDFARSRVEYDAFTLLGMGARSPAPTSSSGSLPE